jgi:hypothetical protein
LVLHFLQEDLDLVADLQFPAVCELREGNGTLGLEAHVDDYFLLRHGDDLPPHHLAFFQVFEGVFV